MRKIIAASLVAASLFAISAPAFAGYWAYGVYYPSCYTVWGPYGWTTACY